MVDNLVPWTEANS